MKLKVLVVLSLVFCVCAAAAVASPQVTRNRRLLKSKANEMVYLIGALFFTEEEMAAELNRTRACRLSGALRPERDEALGVGFQAGR